MDTTTLLKRGKSLLWEAILIAVAASCVILFFRTINYFRSSHSAASKKFDTLSIGSQLRIASVDLSQSPLSIVLISSPTCQYCLASKKFHTQLIVEAERNHVPFYIAVPSSTEASHYSHEVGFAQSSVKEWKDFNMRADATPTILAVDSKGVVKRLWVGVLPPFDESELLSAIKSHSLPSLPLTSGKGTGAPNYSSPELDKLRLKQRINIVDMHERGYAGTRPDAVNLPLIEARYRARFELDKDALQIVDCSNLVLSQCETSVRQLSEAGFRAATLNAGLYRQTCKATLTD